MSGPLARLSGPSEYRSPIRGRSGTVLFNRDASTEFKSNTEVRVRGTGTLSNNNDSRYDNTRNNNGRSREFSYEAIVNNRYRNNTNNVTGIRYDWSVVGLAEITTGAVMAVTEHRASTAPLMMDGAIPALSTPTAERSAC
jgi:hypothetical protein